MGCLCLRAAVHRARLVILARFDPLVPDHANGLPHQLALLLRARKMELEDVLQNVTVMWMSLPVHRDTTIN